MTTIRSIQRYGWRPQLPDARDFKLVHPTAAVQARPKSIDLRSDLPAVWDQDNTGACVGHAVLAAYEYNAKRQGLPLWMPSRLFAYYNARLLEGTTATDAGATIRDGVKGVATYGVPPEADWPYDESKFAVKPTQAAYSVALKNRVVSYLAVNQTIDDICTTLAGREVVVFGFSVYDSFESDAVAKSGVLSMPNLATESLIGGHAVAIAGYDDASSTFLIRNSWGASWGQGGYFTMPYAYASNLALAQDFWVIRQITEH